MRFSLRLRTIGLLLLSYTRAVPGISLLMGIGVFCALAASLTSEQTVMHAWIGAALCFLVASPALSAGMHFRYLASRRLHALLPCFTPYMLMAVLLLMVILATLTTALGSSIIDLHWITLLVLAFVSWSFLFWFGFLPTPLRMMLGFLLIAACFLNLERVQIWRSTIFDNETLVNLLSLTIICMGWAIFSHWFASSMRHRLPFKRIDQARWNLPLALEWNAVEGIGSISGTLLLGQSDALLPCGLRAILGVLGIPFFLYALAWLVAGMRMRELADNAVLVFLAQLYVFGLFTNLCLRASRRRPLLWLRGNWDMRGLSRLAEKILFKEWIALALAWLLLLIIVTAIGGVFPTRLLHLGVAWLMGLSLHVYIALWPRLSDHWLRLSLFIHILFFVLALAMEHIRLDPHALLKFALLQFFAVLIVRQSGLRRVVHGLVID